MKNRTEIIFGTFLALAVIIVTFFTLPGSHVDGSENCIFVEDRSKGCFHDSGGTHKFLPCKGGYIWKDRKISNAEIAKLRKSILKATRKPDNLLQRLGITPNKIAEKRDDILSACLKEYTHWMHHDGGLPQLDSEQEALLTYDVISPRLLSALTDEGARSTTSVLFRVTLPGSPSLQIESTFERYFMLPFTVIYGADKWKIYDPDIPRLLQALADPEGPNYRFLDGFSYWSTELWHDSDPRCPWFWLGRELDGTFCKKTYQAMRGYEQASKAFRIKDADSGYINSQPLSIHLHLEIIEPELVDTIWWGVPFENGKIEHDWLGLLEVIKKAENCIGRHKWVRKWRESAENRSLELDIVGYRGYEEDDLSTWVLPPWNDAGFKGQPEYELYLRGMRDFSKDTGIFEGSAFRQKAVVVTAYFTPAEDRSLLVDLYPGDNPWPKSRTFSFHPWEPYPDYAIVSLDGSLELKRIAPDDWSAPLRWSGRYESNSQF